MLWGRPLTLNKVTKLMARALETQAMRMKERAENSVLVTN